MRDSLADRAAGDPLFFTDPSSSGSATQLTINAWSERLPDIALLHRVNSSSQLF